MTDHPAKAAGASSEQIEAFDLIAAGTRPDCSDADLQWLIDNGLVGAEQSPFNWDVMDYYLPMPVRDSLARWAKEQGETA